ncbi:MAG TPA: hypothetical protein VIJ82_25810 [Streptosporangiaceae bacterium]|jgi:hypothetical protein
MTLIDRLRDRSVTVTWRKPNCPGGNVADAGQAAIDQNQASAR